MAEHASDPAGHEHVRGQMDIDEHRRMYEAFIRFWAMVFGGALLILIFLALFNS